MATTARKTQPTKRKSKPNPIEALTGDAPAKEDVIAEAASSEEKPKGPTLFVVALGLAEGAKPVKPNSVGAALFGIVQAEGQATLDRIVEVLGEREKAGEGLGVKAKEYVDPAKRGKYVSGYVTWLKGNGNLKVVDA